MPDSFHNVSDAALADQIGALDTRIKAYEAEIAPLKDEFKRRGLSAVRGSAFVVTASTSTSKRLDTKKLREALGDALEGYELESTATRITIKAIPQIANAAE
jgi:hypothetical protein